MPSPSSWTITPPTPARPILIYTALSIRPRSLSAKLIERLKVKKIAVRLSTRAGAVEGGTPHATIGAAVMTGPLTVSTSTGESLGADLLFYALGSHPNTEWLATSGILEPSGHVTIAATYAVPGADGVFALGDAAGGADAKAAWLLPNAAAIVAKNICRLATAAAQAKIGNKAPVAPVLAEGPKGGFQGILMVPIGKTDGAGLLPFGIVGPWMVKNIKGGDLFVSKIGSGWGYSTETLLQQK